MVRAREVFEYIASQSPWVDWDETVDGFEYGDSEASITGIAVGWQALQADLQTAYDRGCNLFITHEQTFVSNGDYGAFGLPYDPAEEKRRWLNDHRMVICRCRDAWDTFSEIGCRDAWSTFLGLGEPLASEGNYNLHRLPATTVWELTQRLAFNVKPLGQQAVQLYGPKWPMVHRLAVAVGADARVRPMVALGADVVLLSQDSVSSSDDAGWLAEMGVPLLTVDRRTSETPGMRALAEHLTQQFPDTPAQFVGAGCSYQILATERMRDLTIRMRRDSLDNLPPLALPEGYLVRPMSADETWAYIEVMNHSCFFGDCDEAWFQESFAKYPEYDPSYVQIIWRGDKPVAAACAWQNTIDGELIGQVHWVGALESERGKGLGKAVTLAVLHRLKERGLTCAYLGTQGWRLPAIAGYMRLGFAPWPRSDIEAQEWAQVAKDMAAWRSGTGRGSS